MDWFAWLLPAIATAAMPLPSYEEQLVAETWRKVDAAIQASCTFQPTVHAWACDERLDEALADAQAFQRHVTRHASLEYLVGLAYTYKGDSPNARIHYTAAVELDPSYVAAWYDLGELYLRALELDDAERAFTQVARLKTSGPEAWLGPWRLAEVAAHRHDPAAFEAHMRAALRLGFSFRTIEGLPNWRAFYADPLMRDSIDKLIVVYGDPSTLETLRPVP